MTRLPTLALLGVLLCSGLSACKEREGGETDLTTRVLFTANGSYDTQADTRDRPGGGLRRVQWKTRPPLAARAVTVLYDADARPLDWNMQLDAPTFTAQSLAGEGAQPVQTPDGEGLRPTRGPLRGVLIVKTPGGLRLLTRAYAAQRAQALLPAFR